MRIERGQAWLEPHAEEQDRRQHCSDDQRNGLCARTVAACL